MLPAALFAAFLALQPPPTAPAAEGPSTEVAEVVVTARRSGVPIWRVGDDRSAVVIVGGIGAVPENVAWNTQALEQAVARSRRVIAGGRASFTLGDIFRLLFRRGRYVDLPEGQSLETLTGPELAARLDALAVADRLPRDWRQNRAWFVALRLNFALTREARDGTTALEAAERAARRAHVPSEPVLSVRFNDVLESAAQDRPSDRACLEAAVTAAEAGAAGLRERAEAWSRSRLADVADAPLSRAEGACWPEADPAGAPALRQAWRDAFRRELTQPGVVVAVVPIRYAVERGGLLDDLEAQGLAIEGPSWR